MTTAYPPYRNDDDARELAMHNLEAENARLVTENTRLRNENYRLKTIGSELLKEQPPVQRSLVSYAVDAELRRIISEAQVRTEHLHHQLQELRRVHRAVIMIVIVLASAGAWLRLVAALVP